MSLHNKRRGNAAIFALTLVPLLGFGALSVDIGLQRMTATQIQAAAEAASSGGAAYLNGTEPGLTNAIARAKVIGNLNYVYGDNFEITEDMIQIGTWDPVDGFVQKTVNDPPGEINAVWVFPDTTVDSVLARYAFNVNSLDAVGDAMAVAKRGGVAKYVDCYLPFALPSCVFDGWRDSGGAGNPAPIYLLTDNSDTVAWGLPESGPAVAPPTIQQQLSDACSGVTAATADTGTCSDDGTCSGPIAGDDSELMSVQNGVAATVYSYMGDLINGDIPSENVAPWPVGLDDLPLPNKNDFTNFDPWPEALHPNVTYVDRTNRWGYSINGVVPIIEHDCSITAEGLADSTSLTGNKPIVGWTYAYLYDSGFSGNAKPMMMQFDFVNDYDIGYGQCEGDACEGNVTGTFPPTQVW